MAESQKNKAVTIFKNLVSGSWLTHDETTKLLPFVLFLFLLAIIYIGNGYYAEAKIRKQNKLTEQIRDLRSEYIITKSDLMAISKQSEVAKSIASAGIKESVVPPKKILLPKGYKLAYTATE